MTSVIRGWGRRCDARCYDGATPRDACRCICGGRELTKTAQVRMCGNSVCPPAARALVAANVEVQGQRHMWPGWELAAGGAR